MKFRNFIFYPQILNFLQKNLYNFLLSGFVYTLSCIFSILFISYLLDVEALVTIFRDFKIWCYFVVKVI